MDTHYLEKLLDYTFLAETKFAGLLASPECSTLNEVHKLFSHILAAQQIWFERMNDESMSIKPFELIAPGNYGQMINAHREKYSRYVKLLQEAELSPVIQYKNTIGTEFSSPADEIIIHICNHSTYHRGQINRILREAGLRPIPNDYILYQRGDF